MNRCENRGKSELQKKMMPLKSGANYYISRESATENRLLNSDGEKVR